MATFSPTDAALEGFRLTREKPRMFLAWAVANLIISVIMALVLIAIFGPTLAQFEAMSANVGDPNQAIADLEKIAPFYALMLPAGLLVLAVWMGAVYRAVLRPSDNRFWYLRLGGDELRLAVLILIYVVLLIGFIFVLTLVAGLLSAGAFAIGGPVGAFLSVIIGLASVGVFVWVLVRLSLSGPATFAERHIRVFESWLLTRNVFWPLLGAYVLMLVLLIVVMFLALVIYAAVAAAVMGGDFSQIGKVFQPDTSTLTTYFTPAMLFYLPFGAFLGALQNAIIVAPSALAYRELHGPVEG